MAIKTIESKVVNLLKKSLVEKNFFLIEIDCSMLRNKAEVFEKFTQHFQFPSYFGKNWDAFYDLLTDLSWFNQDKIAIFLKNTHLQGNDCGDTLSEILERASNFWKNDPKKFQVYLIKKEPSKK